MGSDLSGNLISKHAKSVILTGLTTFLVALSSRISNEETKKLAVEISPGVAFIITVIISNLAQLIEYRRSVKAYGRVILRIETRLKDVTISAAESTKLLKELSQHRSRLNEIEIENIKIRF